MKKILIISFMMAILLVGVSLSSSAEEMTGEDVLDNVQESFDAVTSQIEFRMVLHSAAGETRERELNVFAKQEEADKVMIRFVAPPSVEGTAFLNISEDGDEDMYLYMPAVGSARRIASGQRSGSFVGTDFTYNDLSVVGGGNFQEDYEATIIEENEEEYRLRIVPLDEDIQYSSGIMTVQKSNWFPVEIEFFDENEELYKVLTNEEIVQKENYWVAEKITMADVQEGTKTVLYLSKVVYDEPLDDQLFTIRYLERN